MTLVVLRISVSRSLHCPWGRMDHTAMAAMKGECQRQGHALHMICGETFADAVITRTHTAAVLVQARHSLHGCVHANICTYEHIYYFMRPTHSRSYRHSSATCTSTTPRTVCKERDGRNMMQPFNWHQGSSAKDRVVPQKDPAHGRSCYTQTDIPMGPKSECVDLAKLKNKHVQYARARTTFTSIELYASTSTYS